jgi:hypothetical protein
LLVEGGYNSNRYLVTQSIINKGKT